MLQLVLLRHGESVWNLENRFTGWTDVDLTPKGMEEAKEAARLLAGGGFTFDVAYTSLLKRAVRTLWVVLDGMDLMWLPVERSWRLNERHYGALQGLNKAETAARYGQQQVLSWRRSYAEPPPLLSPDDERWPGRDRRYAGLSPSELPRGESLADTVGRFLPYWHDTLAPQVRAGRRLLIAAHGNTLRALVKHLDGIADEEIVGLNIPTGIPLVYELDGDLRPVSSRYLGDSEAARRAAEAVARQAQQPAPESRQARPAPPPPAALPRPANPQAPATPANPQAPATPANAETPKTPANAANAATPATAETPANAATPANLATE